MYINILNGVVIVTVQCADIQAKADGPTGISFRRADGTYFEIGTRAFQLLRRAVNLDKGVPSGQDSKLFILKALRDLNGSLSLLDAKIAVEYFLNNFTESCR